MAINYKAADVADDDHEKSFFTVNQYPAQASIRSPNTINTTNNRLKLFLASFLFLLGTAVISQNTLNKAGLSAASPSSGAYSMRLLSSSYAGSALQITRSSDNTTQNIGFTATGDLDTASLKTFVGINNGYVSTWYDQSSNLNNLTQATLANQPSLVASGVINRENGIPFIRFFTTPSYNSLNLAAGMTTVGHVSAVHLFASGGDGFILGHTGSYYWHSNPGSTSLINSTYASPSVQAGAGWTNGISYLPTSMPWPTTLAINEIEPSPSNNQTTWDNIGRDRTFHYTNNGGGYSELLVFNNALSTSDRQSLESNQGSYFSIATTILPITWVSFTAQLQAEKIVLNWQTATEQNSRDFIVQHSINGTSWMNLATLSASGNSSAIRDYTYIDNKPARGYNYYRIRQSDLDGRNSYSIVRAINVAADLLTFKLITNLVNNGLLQVQVSNAISLSLYSADGKLVWKKHFDAGLQSIFVNGYAKGMYWLKSNKITESVLIQ